MNKLVAIVFNEEKQAYQGSKAIRELDREGAIAVYADVVVAKDAKGTVSVLRAPDAEPIGTASGMLVGGLVGLLGGPAGVAMGIGAGTMIGAAVDLTRAGISGDFVNEVSETLQPGKTAVVAEIDEYWQTPLDSRMEALGGHVFRHNRVDVGDAMFAKEIDAYETELEELEAELNKASAEQKARIEARVQETKRKLQSKREELEAHIDAVKREGDAKIESLQKQIVTARQEQRERMKERLARTRAEYQERTAKLHEAWGLTKSALAP